MAQIIDVSEHNGKIDFAKVKADGIEGVVIRAGYGKGNVDKKFTTNITGAIKNGLKIGIYWFSYAYSAEMASKEAHYCEELIAPYKSNLAMPVFFDWEYDSMKFAKKNGVTPDKSLITEMTKAFCAEIEALGFKGGYYLNLDYSKNYYDETPLQSYSRWFARYIKTEQKNCYLWQKSSSAQINGISGNVDLNVLWGSYFDFVSEPLQSSVEIITKPNSSPQTAQSGYIVGNTYTIKVKTALNVRKGPGKGYALVGYRNLSANAKAHATRGGALKSGTKITCLEIKVIGQYTWMRIPSGWICAKVANFTYVF